MKIVKIWCQNGRTFEVGHGCSLPGGRNSAINHINEDWLLGSAAGEKLCYRVFHENGWYTEALDVVSVVYAPDETEA